MSFTLRQLPLTRWVGFGGALLVAAAGVVFCLTATLLGWPWLVVGGLAIVAGIVMAVRTPGAKVVCTDDHVIVRGLFATRTIPRGSITGITPWPFITWSDARGRRRSTPVTVLNAAGALAPFARHAEDGRRRLHAWAGVGGDFLDPAVNAGR